MQPLVALGIALMVVSCIVSGVDAIRAARFGREPERRIRAFLLAGGILLVGVVLVTAGTLLANG